MKMENRTIHIYRNGTHSYHVKLQYDQGTAIAWQGDFPGIEEAYETIQEYLDTAAHPTWKTWDQRNSVWKHNFYEEGEKMKPEELGIYTSQQILDRNIQETN